MAKRIPITGPQCIELLTLASRLTPDEYQARHRWFAELTDPDFDPAQFEMGALTPMTYGAVITPPFDGAELIADGSDEELIAGIDRGIKLSDILTKSDGDHISFKEACKRGTVNPATNWGQRAAFALRDAGNAGKFSKSVWPVGKYVVCGKARWRNPQYGDVYAWCVVRNEDGFSCYSYWFGFSVNRHGQFVSLDK